MSYALAARASSGSMTTVSTFATGIAHRDAGTQRASTAMSSCAASCNTCCRKGCTRSATKDFGITPGAIMLRVPVSSLALDRSEAPGPKQGAIHPAATGRDCSAASPSSEPRRCPCCKAGHLEYVRKLYPKQVRGP
jgi:hypothetical protein